jgi:hypothetical protein
MDPASVEGKKITRFVGSHSVGTKPDIIIKGKGTVGIVDAQFTRDSYALMEDKNGWIMENAYAHWDRDGFPRTTAPGERFGGKLQYSPGAGKRSKYYQLAKVLNATTSPIIIGVRGVIPEHTVDSLKNLLEPTRGLRTATALVHIALQSIPKIYYLWLEARSRGW